MIINKAVCYFSVLPMKQVNFYFNLIITFASFEAMYIQSYFI